MIRLADRSLSPDAVDRLAEWQREVDAVPSFSDRTGRAKSMFASRNRADNKTFAHVRDTLDSMCTGPRRCMYCEDSAADEVEHVRPKNLYPEFTFVWENYVYACGTCNGPKGNRFAVVSENGEKVPHTAPAWDTVRGDTPALIDPRSEDPFTFLELDLAESFLFVPTSGLSRRDTVRAEYTCELLNLNGRGYLVKARRNAFEACLSQLALYAARRPGRDPSDPELDRCRRVVMNSGHPTVWHEMCRQHQRFLRADEWGHRFVECPEALGWLSHQTSSTPSMPGWD
jgi:uncharacterized protein (TIGR02646 family)